MLLSLCTSGTKLRAANQQDFRSGKNISKICSENPPEVTDKPIEKIINGQLGHLM